MHTPTTKNVIFKPISPKRDKAMITLTILPIHCINLIASNGFYSLSLSHTHTIYLHCGILLKHGILSGVFWDTYLSCVFLYRTFLLILNKYNDVTSANISYIEKELKKEKKSFYSHRFGVLFDFSFNPYLGLCMFTMHKI